MVLSIGLFVVGIALIAYASVISLGGPLPLQVPAAILGLAMIVTSALRGLAGWRRRT